VEQSLHVQVQHTIRGMVERGEYASGDRIPSERELAEEMGISRMTIRRALDELVRAGLLERRSTSGTYVREASVVRRVGVGSTLGLTQLLEQEGAAAGSRLLSFHIEPASRQIAAQLDVPAGVAVVRLRRLRLANDEPFCVETSYLPRARVPNLAADDIAGQGSLYALLSARYGIEIGSSDEVLSVTRVDADDASALGLVPHDSALLLRATTRDTNGQPIEYLHSVNHPDRVAFRTVSAAT
jgi:GntR family transcriptional regulator